MIAITHNAPMYTSTRRLVTLAILNGQYTAKQRKSAKDSMCIAVT